MVSGFRFKVGAFVDGGSGKGWQKLIYAVMNNMKILKIIFFLLIILSGINSQEITPYAELNVEFNHYIKEEIADPFLYVAHDQGHRSDLKEYYCVTPGVDSSFQFQKISVSDGEEIHFMDFLYDPHEKKSHIFLQDRNRNGGVYKLSWVDGKISLVLEYHSNDVEYKVLPDILINNKRFLFEREILSLKELVVSIYRLVENEKELLIEVKGRDSAIYLVNDEMAIVERNLFSMGSDLEYVSDAQLYSLTDKEMTNFPYGKIIGYGKELIVATDDDYKGFFIYDSSFNLLYSDSSFDFQEKIVDEGLGLKHFPMGTLTDRFFFFNVYSAFTNYSYLATYIFDLYEGKVYASEPNRSFILPKCPLPFGKAGSAE